jgi:hypothetical protein
MPRDEYDYEVVWHGAMVDSLGTKGGLLPPYEHGSAWGHIENYFRVRLGRCPTRRGRRSNAESPDDSAPPESLPPVSDSELTEVSTLLTWTRVGSWHS